MKEFDELPEPDQAALLVKLLLAMTEAGCGTIEELACRRDRAVTDVWKDLCAQVNQAECVAPRRLDSLIADQVDSGDNGLAATDAPEVKARRYRDRDDVEMHQISNIFGWHWDQTDGEEPQKLACGYVWSNELKEGQTGWSGLYGSDRERMKVYVLKEENLEVWDDVLRLCDGSQRLNSEARERLKMKQRFKNRGLSNATVTALIAAGLDAPERLLFLDARELKKLRGVGPVKLREIASYRATFLPQSNVESGDG